MDMNSNEWNEFVVMTLNEWEWESTACGIEVKFVATITSFSSTFSELSPMFSYLGQPFSSCVKHDAPLNYETSLNFTFLLHLLAISAGLHSVGT